MIKELIFNRGMFFSLASHLAAFSIFGFSFGANLPKADYAELNFRGAILSSVDFIAARKGLFKKNRVLPVKKSAAYADLSVVSFLNKPPAVLTFNRNKLIQPGLSAFFAQKRPVKPAIMFYPRLPGKFSLYFKLRKQAHIELLFYINRRELVSPVTVKRKVSSGNLEADLLCMRYISHYLFIEQLRFSPDTWQLVRIDLSEKDDRPGF